MLPLSCSTDSYSCSSIHCSISRSITANVIDAASQQNRAEHRHISAGHKHFQRIGRAMNAARRRQIRADPAVENRDPAHRQPHRHWRAQQNVGRNLERLQLDVGLIKTIEEHQRVGAVLIGSAREVQKLVKNGLSFTATGIFNCAFTEVENREVFVFDFLGRQSLDRSESNKCSAPVHRRRPARSAVRIRSSRQRLSR